MSCDIQFASVGEPAEKALLVRDVDNPGRAPYQERETFAFVGLCSSNFCTVEFSPVPAGRRLSITRVTGALHLTPGITPDELWRG